MAKIKLQERYTGGIADTYDEIRVRREGEKWRSENQIIARILAKLSSEDGVETVLDAPVGTGRFLPIYCRLSLKVTGCDISDDMLRHAANHASHKQHLQLKKANVFDLRRGDVTCDAVVCNRFANWLDPSQLHQLIDTFCALAPRYIILGVRTDSKTDSTSPNTRTTPANRTARHLMHGISIFRKQGVIPLLRSAARYAHKRLIERPPPLIIHSSAQISAVFQSHDYSIQDMQLVEASPDATNLHIYLLAANS